MNFYESWHYLEDHPMFIDSNGNSAFHECLDIDVVLVSPKSGKINDIPEFNTKTEIWLEAGPWISPISTAHDCDLDCGGDTFEDAIIKLADLVKKYYGDNISEIQEKIKNQYDREY